MKIQEISPKNASRLEIIKAFMPAIRYWAKHYYRKKSQILEFDDLVMCGIIGLIDAINKFKREKKNQFKTYAEFRIRGQIIDELRHQDWLTRSERDKQKVFNHLQKDLTDKLGRVPTHKEMSSVFPHQEEVLYRMEIYQKGDNLKTYDEDTTISFNLHDHQPIEEFELRQSMTTLIEKLPLHFNLVLSLKYYEDLSLSEIAQELHLSEGRVSQIHSEAIVAIKKMMKNQEIIYLAA